MRGLGPDVVSVVGPTGVELLSFFYSGMQIYILFSPYLCISRFVFTSRFDIDNLGIFDANQTSLCLNPHQK